MGLHYSESAEQVKLQAAEISRRWKHHFLSCEHYFYASCSVDPGCRAWLTRRGLSLEELADEILRLVPEGDEIPGWEGLIESPRLRRVLPRMAQEDAEAQRCMRIEPIHIVSAILREGRNLPVRILAEAGNQLEPVRRELLGGPVGPQSPGRPRSEGGGAAGGGEAASPSARPGKEKFLSKYARDLVEVARSGKVDPVVGRSDEIRRVLQILTRKTKSNPVLIGEAGVGKTAVVFGLAQRIADGQVPDILRDRRVLDLNLSSMVAGAKHRGEFEERLEGVVKEACADPSIILFIDEIHQLVGAGDSRGGMDASNILKPALARGDFPVLGATTTDEYRRYIEADPALERRFQPVLVGEPSEADALKILQGVQGRYESHHGVKFTERALLAAVKLSVRFLPDRNLPDKAFDLIDEAAAQIKTRSGVLSASNPVFEVDEDVVAEVVSNWTGIPVSRMTSEESARLLEMEDLLRQRVVGQDHAVEAVAQTIRVVRVGLVSPNRPGGVFLFLGPSGVGKTELAKGLAEFLFGSEKEMVRLDMSEYHDKHSLARLIGSPPGYVGHEEEGQLTRAVRTRPYSVVLLDEVEKAHPEVFDIFLQVFDDGRLTDSKGRTVNFANTIIVLTSNLGSREVISQPDYENRGVAGQLDQLPPLYQNALRGHFRPEFLNRLDEIVVFRSLDKSNLIGIVKIHLNKLVATLSEKEIALDIEPEAVDFLLEHGYQAQFGARPLQRAINTYLSRPLAQEMLRAQLGAGTRMVAYRDGDRLAFKVSSGGVAPKVSLPSETVGRLGGRPDPFEDEVGDSHRSTRPDPFDDDPDVDGRRRGPTRPDPFDDEPPGYGGGSRRPTRSDPFEDEPRRPSRSDRYDADPRGASRSDRYPEDPRGSSRSDRYPEDPRGGRSDRYQDELRRPARQDPFADEPDPRPSARPEPRRTSSDPFEDAPEVPLRPTRGPEPPTSPFARPEQTTDTGTVGVGGQGGSNFLRSGPDKLRDWRPPDRLRERRESDEERPRPRGNPTPPPPADGEDDPWAAFRRPEDR